MVSRGVSGFFGLESTVTPNLFFKVLLDRFRAFAIFRTLSMSMCSWAAPERGPDLMVVVVPVAGSS
jgi:presenilin-like A22 family membrane protease